MDNLAAWLDAALEAAPGRGLPPPTLLLTRGTAGAQALRGALTRRGGTHPVEIATLAGLPRQRAFPGSWAGTIPPWPRSWPALHGRPQLTRLARSHARALRMALLVGVEAQVRPELRALVDEEAPQDRETHALERLIAGPSPWARVIGPSGHGPLPPWLTGWLGLSAEEAPEVTVWETVLVPDPFAEARRAALAALADPRGTVVVYQDPATADRVAQALWRNGIPGPSPRAGRLAAHPAALALLAELPEGCTLGSLRARLDPGRADAGALRIEEILEEHRDWPVDRRLLAMLLDEVQPRDEVPDGVRLVHVDELDAFPSSRLVIVDAHSGGLGKVPAPDPLLDDRARQALGIPAGAAALEARRGALALAASRADEVLVISSLRDERGRERFPWADLPTRPREEFVAAGGLDLPLPENGLRQRHVVRDGPALEPPADALATQGTLEWLRVGFPGPEVPGWAAPWLGAAAPAPVALSRRRLRDLSRCGFRAWARERLALADDPPRSTEEDERWARRFRDDPPIPFNGAPFDGGQWAEWVAHHPRMEALLDELVPEAGPQRAKARTGARRWAAWAITRRAAGEEDLPPNPRDPGPPPGGERILGGAVGQELVAAALWAQRVWRVAPARPLIEGTALDADLTLMIGEHPVALEAVPQVLRREGPGGQILVELVVDHRSAPPPAWSRRPVTHGESLRIDADLVWLRRHLPAGSRLVARRDRWWLERAPDPGEAPPPRERYWPIDDAMLAEAEARLGRALDAVAGGAWNLTGQAAVCPHGSGFAPDCPVKVACRKRSPAGRSL